MDAKDARDTSDRWVEDRLRALDPPDTWEPATNIALAHFRERAAANAAPGWGARLGLRLGLGLRPGLRLGLRSRLRRRQLVYATSTHETSGPISSVPSPTSSSTASPAASRMRGLGGLFASRDTDRLEKGRAPIWIAAGVFACLLLLLTPVPRAAAQRIWDMFFVERIEFVTLDVDRLPRSFTDQRIELIGPNHMRVANVQDAATHARFTPRLPDPHALMSISGSGGSGGSVGSVGRGEPTLSVSGTASLEWRVNATDLQAAAHNAGLADVQFPREWDGVRLGIHASPIVIATYPNFELIQLMPLAITTPPGFNLGAFTERVLRVAGMSPPAARSFARQMAAAPFALCAIEPDEKVTMRQVRLKAGEGTIIHDLNDDDSLQRATLVWSTPDRLYAISSNLSDDEVIAIANAIPQD